MSLLVLLGSLQGLLGSLQGAVAGARQPASAGDPLLLTGSLVRAPDGADTPVAGARLYARRLATPYEELRSVLEGGTPTDQADGATSETTSGDSVGKPRAETGEDGRFALALPSAGLWSLEIDAGADRLRVDLAIVESRDLGRIVLPEQEWLEVSVRGPSGGPVAGARVALLGARQQVSRASKPDEPSPVGGFAVTGKDGTARLRRPIGTKDRYRVVAIAERLALAHRRASGRRVELQLEAAPGRSWRVLEPTGSPAAFTVVALDGVPLAMADEAGLLELAVPRGGLERALLTSPTGSALFTILRGSNAPPPRTASEAGDPTREEPSEGESAAAEEPPPPVSLGPAIEVTGRVLSTDDGTPIAGALVFGAGVAVFAGADGSFGLRIPPVDPIIPWANFLVTALAPGHLAGSQGKPREAGRTHVGPLRVELERGVLVEGNVVDATDGRPIEGASISAEDETSVTSGRAGEFRLRASLRGLQDLTVSHAGYAPLRRTITARDLPPYSPLLRLELSRGRSAIGWVVDPDDRPIAGATVELWRRASNPWSVRDPTATATSDARGVFRFRRLAADTYDLVAVAPSFAQASVPGLEIASEGGELELGTIALDRAAIVDVRVVDPDGAPLPGVDLTHWSQRQVQTQSWQRRRHQPLQTDAAGFARIDHHVADDSIEVSARLDGYTSARATIEPPTLEPHVLVLEPGIALRGSVRDPAGRPLINALVQTRSSTATGFRESRQERTDATGVFVLDGLSAGEYRILVHAAGFLEEEVEGVVLEAGVEPDPVDVRLSRGATLAGRVTDRDGEPLEGVGVGLPLDRAAMRFLAPRSTRDRTDDEGRYRIEGLPLGDTTISADANGRRGVVRDVVLEAGVNRLDLELEAALQISGRVVDPEGLPVAGAEIFLLGNGSRPQGYARSGIDGEFLAEVEDGARVTLGSRKRGVGASAEVGPIEVHGSSISGIELRLESGGAIVGWVLGPDVDEMSRVRLLASAAHQENAWSRVEAQPDYEGRFRLEPVAAGEWLVTASLEGRSVRASVDLPDASSEASVDLVFEPGHTLSGVVLDGGLPADGLGVTASGIDVLGNGRDSTDAEGRFELTDLATGAYRLTVWHRGPAHEQVVEVDGDRDVVVELPGGRISGRVVDEEGVGIAGAALLLRREDQLLEGRRRAGTSTRDGSFELAGVGAGRWVVEAAHEGYVPAIVEVEIDELGVDRLRLELVREAHEATELNLVTPNGEIPRGAYLVLQPVEGGALQSRRYSAGESGRIVLDDVPPGRWLAAIVAGSLVAEIEITVPARPRRVMLAWSAWIEVVAPELIGTGALRPLTLSRTPAQPSDELWAQMLRQQRLVDGRTTIGTIPAGVWSIAVEIEPGRTVERSVTVASDQRVRVELE
ncbi:MAG TPA: carboxypeptidase regulatory-like domain-containing protein [Thermoanaerobaculia bacterium]|nr:carboxypeptidase regulatory-like domain-containing protein [Thermoanaerobaculia bacterium]